MYEIIYCLIGSKELINFEISELLIQDIKDIKITKSLCYHPVKAIKCTAITNVEGQLLKAVDKIKLLLNDLPFTYRFYDVTIDNIIIIVYPLTDLTQRRVKTTLIEEFKTTNNIDIYMDIDELGCLIVQQKNNIIIQLLHTFLKSKNIQYEILWADERVICIYLM